MTSLTRAFMVAAVGLLATVAIVILLHDPPYPTPPHLGDLADSSGKEPWSDKSGIHRRLIRATPLTRLMVPEADDSVYLVAATSFLSHHAYEEPRQRGDLSIYRRPRSTFFDASGSGGDAEQQQHGETELGSCACASIQADDDAQGLVHLLYYAFDDAGDVRFRLRTYAIARDADVFDEAACDAYAAYGKDTAFPIFMCETALPGSAWIEDLTVDAGLAVYSRWVAVYAVVATGQSTLIRTANRRPDVALFRTRKLSFASQSDDTPQVNIGPVIAEVRQQDLMGKFSFIVRLASNAPQMQNITPNDLTLKWNHKEVLNYLYHSIDGDEDEDEEDEEGGGKNDVNGYDNSPYGDGQGEDSRDHGADKTKAGASLGPVPLIGEHELRTAVVCNVPLTPCIILPAKGDRVTIVAFPHSRVIFSLDELNEVTGEYARDKLEVPYVEHIASAVTGLHVNREGTHMAADNTVLVFARGATETFLDALLSDEDTNANADAANTSASDLFRSLRDELARRWRLRSIIRPRAMMREVLATAFFKDHPDQAPMLLLLHANGSVSGWRLVDHPLSWSWPFAMLVKRWGMSLAMLAVVASFAFHELRM
ncbi:hypothetical protein THASP1DRAFT_25144 [Thamnocephalis sphaerospora]|uniref:Uncharacterized protein n=1 Tax=Thamnocephalis sphaerospora TaxID=78915 RepID=A0A4P9XMG3_9FUNG|nr:hypothetical protein THASP1DRAFT_25144 [Thamnocephalis sphaerospora]|eukprot:RKP06561.1 hypothetical protein THASP1DRAFT_25144 [Thamnocephalis sphaerospora]